MVFVGCSKKIEILSSRCHVPVDWSTRAGMLLDHFIADWEVRRVTGSQTNWTLEMRWRKTSEVAAISRNLMTGPGSGELMPQFALRRDGDILLTHPFTHDLRPCFRKVNYFCDDESQGCPNMRVETDISISDSGVDITWTYYRGKVQPYWMEVDTTDSDEPAVNP